MRKGMLLTLLLIWLLPAVASAQWVYITESSKHTLFTDDARDAAGDYTLDCWLQHISKEDGEVWQVHMYVDLNSMQYRNLSAVYQKKGGRWANGYCAPGWNEIVRGSVMHKFVQEAYALAKNSK